jgi:single-stranded-DNA-specific exonuclease
VIVIDHHRIQDRADTLAVWSDEFCGAGLAVLFAVGLALRVGWSARAVEQLIEGASIYGAIASRRLCPAGARPVSRELQFYKARQSARHPLQLPV